MASISPLPGLISTPAVRPSVIQPRPTVRSWLARFIAPEASDVPATIAVAASCLAAAWSLGDLLWDAGFLGLFPYRIIGVLLYGAPFLYGCIIAGGFTSRSRTAQYLGIVATTAIAATSLAFLLGWTGLVAGAGRIGGGVALLAGIVVWGLRGLRRLTLPSRGE